MAMARAERGPQLQRAAREVAQSSWVERCARVGYAAKGAVYAIIGALAVQVALGQGGRTTDSEGALAKVAAQPFGAVLLAALALGLVGFVVWRFVQAFVDPEHKGTKPKGLALRALYLFSGLVYAGLALSALRLLLGRGRHGSGHATQSWTARLLEQPFGQVLVALLGLGVIGFAVQQLHKAWKGKFLHKLDLSRLRVLHHDWAVRISRVGLAARGVVFGLMGVFFVRAALHANAREAKGVGETLSTLARQPEGDLLLGAVALGLVAYAVYLFIEARCRRIGTA